MKSAPVQALIANQSMNFTAASIAKKNVVDNNLFEPMPRYSVNVSLKFYAEAKP